MGDLVQKVCINRRPLGPCQIVAPNFRESQYEGMHLCTDELGNNYEIRNSQWRAANQAQDQRYNAVASTSCDKKRAIVTQWVQHTVSCDNITNKVLVLDDGVFRMTDCLLGTKQVGAERIIVVNKDALNDDKGRGIRIVQSMVGDLPTVLHAENIKFCSMALDFTQTLPTCKEEIDAVLSQLADTRECVVFIALSVRGIGIDETHAQLKDLMLNKGFHRCVDHQQGGPQMHFWLFHRKNADDNQEDTITLDGHDNGSDDSTDGATSEDTHEIHQTPIVDFVRWSKAVRKIHWENVSSDKKRKLEDCAYDFWMQLAECQKEDTIRKRVRSEFNKAIKKVLQIAPRETVRHELEAICNGLK